MRISSNELRGSCSCLNGLLNEESFRILLTLRKNTWCLVAVWSWVNMSNCLKCSNTSALMGPSLVLEGYHSLGLCEEYPGRRFYVGCWNRISSAVASAMGAIWIPDVLTSEERVKSQWKPPVGLSFESHPGFAPGSSKEQCLPSDPSFSFCSYMLFLKSWHHSNCKQGPEVDLESWERRNCHFPGQFTQLMGNLFRDHHISAA